MQNYFSGLFISMILHMGLILSFTNFFKIQDLYSLNKVDPMPAYLILENPEAELKKIDFSEVKDFVNERIEVKSPIIETTDARAELEAVKVDKDTLINEILKREFKSSLEEISYYSNLIRDQVMMNWKQPSSAIKGMSAELVITLVPTGEIIQIELVRSSGNLAFDNSSINAVQKVSKFDGLTMGNRLFNSHFRKFTLVFNPEN